MSNVRDAIRKALEGSDLGESRARRAMLEILRGEATPAQIAALLVALRMKGETSAEITGFAGAMRASALPVRPARTSARDLVDTCGTGGDGGRTFNVSTAAALVVAGCGVPVAKHGNRSVSSRCGSADVLEALGVAVTLDEAAVAQCIDDAGIGFLFAQSLHPAMRHAGPVRKELGVRTVFNMLGPLTNPARASLQVIGVYEDRIVPLVAGALATLGARRALVVHGCDGLDEITLSGPTHFAEVREGQVREGQVRPEDFGAATASAAEIAGGSAHENAARIRSVLGGSRGPCRDIVVVNAAAALRMAGRGSSWRECAGIAEASIDSGQAANKLAALADLSARLAVEPAGSASP